MDWQLAITRNREALLIVVAALMRSVGLIADGTLTTLPHFLYRKALLIVRQAESAVRRLIVIAAHDMKLRGFNLSSGAPASGLPLKGGTEMQEVVQRTGEGDLVRQNPSNEGQRRRSFNLVDALKTFDQDTPDFAEIYSDHMGIKNYEPIPAASLGHRILALNHALNSIPKLAKRLARWYQQRDLALAQNHPRRLSPLRPGPPPASRQRKRTEIEKILSECHSLAIYARDRRDSS